MHGNHGSDLIPPEVVVRTVKPQSLDACPLPSGKKVKFNKKRIKESESRTSHSARLYSYRCKS